MMTTTRREFFTSAIPVAVVSGAGISLLNAQTGSRPEMVDPVVNAVSQELFAAVRARPDLETLKRAARLFAAVAEKTGYAARIDALVRRPDTAQRVFAALNDHERHHADRAVVLALAPELVYVSPQVMPTRTMQDTEQAVAYFRQHGFASAMRQMADNLPSDGDVARLDWDCGNWGQSCLFWYAATVWICMIPSGWGCLLGYLLDAWVCAIWMQCQP